MGRIRRGGYIFEWWVGDHAPRHVHVYSKGVQIAKITVPQLKVLSGEANKRILKTLEQLINEGRI